jgi:protein-tyrosine phosphatase
MQTIRILFVCMGNICRSPSAEGIFRDLIEREGLIDRFFVDSAGTHGYHVDEPPDPRAQETARGRGIDISGLRARQVVKSDFEAFDYLLAMDRYNYKLLSRACPPHLSHKLRYFLEFAPHLATTEVPDPYYGGDHGFERVYDMMEDAAKGLIDALRRDELRSTAAGG